MGPGRRAVTGFVHSQDFVVRPSDPTSGRAGDLEAAGAPRSTPREWARRRRIEKQGRRGEAARERTKGRLNRLGDEWILIDSATLGLPSHESFLAIGPGGVFA